MEPKSVREVALSQQGFERHVIGQFDLLKWGIGSLFAMLVGIVGGGFAMYNVISSVQTGVAGIKQSVEDIDKRLVRVETDLRTFGGSVTSKLDSINSAVAVLKGGDAQASDKDVFAAVALSAAEQDFIRKFLKVQGLDLKAMPKFVVGDTLPEGLIKGPVPDALAKAVPRIAKFRFAYDPGNGSAVFVDSSNRAVAVIAPV